MTKPMSLLDYYILTNQDQVLISYKGPVTPVIMAEISSDIRNKLASSPKASRKVFSVFMELAQNILYYSAEKASFANRKDSIGMLLLKECADCFEFSCCNLVESAYVNELNANCETINSLDREELRKYRREQRNKPQNERSKGAGIGLIHVAITSENPLTFESRKVNDKFSFFSISVTVPKD